jgi:hypothetical protein
MSLKRVSEIIKRQDFIDDSIKSNDYTYSSQKIEEILSNYLLNTDSSVLKRINLIPGYKISFDYIDDNIVINALIDDASSESLLSQLTKLVSLLSNNIVLPGDPSLEPDLNYDIIIKSYLDLLFRNIIMNLNNTSSLNNIYYKLPNTGLSNFDSKYIKSYLNLLFRDDNYFFDLVTLPDLDLYDYNPVLNANFASNINIAYDRLSNNLNLLISLFHDKDKDYPFVTSPYLNINSKFNISMREDKIKIYNLSDLFDEIIPYNPELNVNFTTFLNINQNNRLNFINLLLESLIYNSNLINNEDLSFDSNINIQDSITVRDIDLDINNNISISNIYSNQYYEDVNALLNAPISFSYTVKSNKLVITNLLIDQSYVRIKDYVLKIIDESDNNIDYYIIDDITNINYNFDLEKSYTISIALANNYFYNNYNDDYTVLNYSPEISNIDVSFNEILLSDTGWTNYSSQTNCLVYNHDYTNYDLLSLNYSSGYYGGDRYISFGTANNISELRIVFDENFYGNVGNANMMYSCGYALLSALTVNSSYPNYVHPTYTWFGSAYKNFLSPPTSLIDSNWQSIDMYYNFNDDTYYLKKNNVENTFVSTNTDTTYRTFPSTISDTVSFYNSAKKTSNSTIYFCFGLLNRNNYTLNIAIRNFKIYIKKK